MYQTTMSILKDAGYSQYEASSYAKKTKECIHNLHYWNLDPYLAFGPSAHGYDGKTRWWNHRSLDMYISDIQSGKLPINNKEVLNPKNHYNEIIMNGLKTSNGININELKKIDGNLDLDNMILKWPQLIIKNDRLKLMNNDFMLLDEITADLFI